jgi:Toprim-like
MSMLVDGEAIKAHCHRASCGFKYSAGYAVDHGLRPSRVRPYTGALALLDRADFVWLCTRFDAPISAFGAMRKSDGRYFLPIIGPEGTRRGWVSRRPWEGSPLWDAGDKSPKSLTYMETDEPVQCWNTFGGVPVDVEDTVVLVEDQISATRVLIDTSLVSVAILGTGINEEKVSELQRHARNILIALDADATGQSFSMARKWGQAFGSCRVVILSKDIKDMQREMVQETFQPFFPKLRATPVLS